MRERWMLACMRSKVRQMACLIRWIPFCWVKRVIIPSYYRKICCFQTKPLLIFCKASLICSVRVWFNNIFRSIWYLEWQGLGSNMLAESLYILFSWNISINPTCILLKWNYYLFWYWLLPFLLLTYLSFTLCLSPAWFQVPKVFQFNRFSIRKKSLSTHVQVCHYWLWPLIIYLHSIPIY